MLFFMGRNDDAKAYLSDSLAIARETESAKWVAAVLQPLGMAYLSGGDTYSARILLEEAVALARQLENKRELTSAINALAMVHRLDNRLDMAEPLCNQVVVLTRELGDQEYMAIGLLNLAMVLIGRGERQRASAMVLEVIDIAEKIGSKPVAQSTLEVCAGLAAENKCWSDTARLLGAAEAQREQIELRRDPADEAFLAPLVARAKLSIDSEQFAVAEAEGRMSAECSLQYARTWLTASMTPMCDLATYSTWPDPARGSS
jgi:tetratricopeptide (TPR) repeat protein